VDKQKRDLLCIMLHAMLIDAEKACDPRCRYEVRQWKHGAYTLVHDTDLTACEFALDAIFFCCCKGLFFASAHYFVALSLSVGIQPVKIVFSKLAITTGFFCDPAQTEMMIENWLVKPSE